MKTLIRHGRSAREGREMMQPGNLESTKLSGSFVQKSMFILLLLLSCLSFMPVNCQVNDCMIGRSSVSQDDNQTLKSKSGQFIDKNAPASCDGEIIGIVYCYRPAEVPSSVNEVTIRIWRLVNGSLSKLQAVDRYNFTVRANSASRGDLNDSICANESMKDGEQIQFQRGDFVGFLFPLNTGLELAIAVANDVLTEEGQGLYRDNRMEDRYDEPLNPDTDLEMEAGLMFNIKIEVSAHRAQPVSTFVQDSLLSPTSQTTPGNIPTHTQTVHPFASSDFHDTSLTSSVFMSDTRERGTQFGGPKTVVSSSVLPATSNIFFAPITNTILSSPGGILSSDVMPSSIVIQPSVFVVIDRKTLSKMEILTSMNTLYPGKGLNMGSTQIPVMVGMLSSSFDLESQSHLTESTNVFIPNKVATESNLLHPASITDELTTSPMPTPNTATDEGASDLLRPFPTLDGDTSSGSLSHSNSISNSDVLIMPITSGDEGMTMIGETIIADEDNFITVDVTPSHLSSQFDFFAITSSSLSENDAEFLTTSESARTSRTSIEEGSGESLETVTANQPQQTSATPTNQELIETNTVSMPLTETSSSLIRSGLEPTASITKTSPDQSIDSPISSEPIKLLSTRLSLPSLPSSIVASTSLQPFSQSTRSFSFQSTALTRSLLLPSEFSRLSTRLRSTASLSPENQLPMSITTTSQLTSTPLPDVLESTMATIKSTSTRSAFISSSISPSISVEVTALPVVSVNSTMIGITTTNTLTKTSLMIIIPSISSLHTSVTVTQLKPTQFITAPIPDLRTKITGDLIAWVAVISVLFATISGCVMFISLYFSHFRKINKVHTIPPDYTVGIDNPSYSMKSSEEGIESSNPILTDISVDETLKPAASFELDNGTDDNAGRNSPLIDSSSLPGLDSSTVPNKNTPSKVVSASSFKTEVSREEGGSGLNFIMVPPTVTEHNDDSDDYKGSEMNDGRLNSAMSGRTHDYEELNGELFMDRVTKRQSHQYEEPDPPPEDRPAIARDYEMPISMKWKRLSLPTLEEDSPTSLASMPRRNSSACDSSMTSTELASESTSSALPPQRIRHYAEFSIPPLQQYSEDITPRIKYHPVGCQKVHSFSFASRQKCHDYEEPFCQPFPYSYAVPMPFVLTKRASDYEIPVTTTSLQRAQSTRPEQFSTAIKRRNHLNLIIENGYSKIEENVKSVVEEDEILAESFDCDESIISVRSEFSCDSKLSSPLPSNESLSPVMDGAYISPSSNEQELNSVISKLSVSAISYAAIENGWRMNEPEQRAVWKRNTDGSRIDVTIKSADSTDPESSNNMDVLQELAMMAQFRHPNIVKLHGAVNDGRHTILVSEYFPIGDLRKVLVQMGRSVIPPDTPQLLLSYCQQAALGMQYLASKGFVHRDLSARNIFVSKNDICKVGGFDKSRDLANVNDYIAKGGKMQVRWMAPEAIHHCQYSTASDIWSYGCLLYEIWSLGRMPFRDSSNAEVIDKVDSGYRLPPPPGCPLVIYNLMMQCWHPNPFSRPCFKDIITTLLKDEDTILKIPIRDASTYSSAIILGASLKAGAYMYSDLQQKYARRASHINRRSVSFKSHDYDHIQDDKFMLTFPTSSAELASEPKSKKQRFEIEESCEVGDVSLVPQPSLYSEPVVVSKFSQSLPISTWTCSDYEDIIDL